MLKIPVYQPFLNGNEKKYVNECLDANWISSKGEFIHKFESAFAGFTGSRFATSVSNGTVAIHLALLALGIEPGDEIIVPTFTYVASVNTIVQAGAKPVFVDSLPDTWQIDPADVERKITDKTRAVMAVHLYGHPCDMPALQTICKKHHLLMIEDCAEAFGSYYNDQHVGTFGDIATFSFFGNKTITTGEGGMVIMQNPEVYAKAAHLKNQGVSTTKQYWHDVVGYNYRMTNICAAIGLAQLEQIEEILQRKRHLANAYAAGLTDLPLQFLQEIGPVKNSYWMCSIVLDDAAKRDVLRDHLAKHGIETRPFFYPSHHLPMYQHLGRDEDFPVAVSLSERGINLPSWPGMGGEEIKFVVQTIKAFF